ncbi:hypothetical protein BaRGS_00027276 [Batillaria attramentaria]|uniref:Uncharacterized protein n=1 Tax=Batillaria attramentaria TaxID=370345 RepID=A0ABD0K388_9CAEN
MRNIFTVFVRSKTEISSFQLFAACNRDTFHATLPKKPQHFHLYVLVFASRDPRCLTLHSPASVTGPLHCGTRTVTPTGSVKFAPQGFLSNQRSTNTSPRTVRADKERSFWAVPYTDFSKDSLASGVVSWLFPEYVDCVGLCCGSLPDKALFNTSTSPPQHGPLREPENVEEPG